MKARIWKEDGAWHFDVRSRSLRCTGERLKWEDALSQALAELAWFAEVNAERE